MKRVIPFLLLIAGISVASCRQIDEQLDSTYNLSRTTNVSNKISDSTKHKVELEKDPPVKDGQDWKH